MAVAFVSINSLSKKIFLTGKIPLEIDNAASTGIHGNYMKYGQLSFASSVSTTNTIATGVNSSRKTFLTPNIH
jgi:hypothetical protein